MLGVPCGGCCAGGAMWGCHVGVPCGLGAFFAVRLLYGWLPKARERQQAGRPLQ